MLTLGAIAVVIMCIILLVLVQRAMATAAARRHPRRRHLGIRARRLPGHPAHRRDDRRAAGDARHRHRLRDPDARACRGRGDHRPLRAPDPGDCPQPRPGAVGRHLRRHLRLRSAAFRQGADDPTVRTVAGGRHRRHLSVLDRPPARHSRHPRVPVADEGQGLPPRATRPSRGVARIAAGEECDPAGHLQPRDLRRRHHRRGQVVAADRPDPVGQPEVAGDQGHRRGRTAGALVERDGCLCHGAQCVHGRGHRVRPHVHR